ncbi:hypothetical protein PIB30_093419, partial [Stylosanthes scabra]|nr:hypothetical protein [Stylosanthes scabra]
KLRLKTTKDAYASITPPQVKKKNRKEPVKSVKKKKFKEDEARKKIELKCANVDDLVSKLKAFKGALHNNKSLETHLGVRPHDPSHDRAVTKSHFGCSLSPSRRRTPLHMPLHEPCARAVPLCKLMLGQLALGPNCIFRHAPACFSPRYHTGPKNEHNGPLNRACDRVSGSCDHAVPSAALKCGKFSTHPSFLSFSLKFLHTHTPPNTQIHSHTNPSTLFLCVQSLTSHCQMARKGKEFAFASTPSRNRTTKNSNRGRDEGFPTKRFDSQIHHDRWKTMEHRGIMHERIIRFPDREPDFMREHVEELGWGFMYNAFPRSMSPWCENFAGRLIPFSEDDIRHFLGINVDLTPLGEDDMFKATVENRKRGELDMDMVFQQHGATFDLDHAILIYVLMTEGVVNLPHIMRDDLQKRPTRNSCNLLPYPVFISRLASRYQVPKFSRDEIYHVWEQDMFCPYGDWKGASLAKHAVHAPGCILEYDVLEPDAGFINPRSRQVYRIVSSNTTVKWVSIPRGLKD